MKILCISAANIKHQRHNSTSVHACELIQKLAVAVTNGNADVEVVALADYEPAPCIGCGGCYTTGVCVNDNTFNTIFEKMQQSDCIFIVSPHYAPIPAKLCMVLEKLEEIAYLHWFGNHSYKAALYEKPVGIVAHCGSDDRAALPAYRQSVLGPISDALSTAMLSVIDGGESNPNGVVFMLESSSESFESIFPVQSYDWALIETELAPLVKNVINQVHTRQGS